MKNMKKEERETKKGVATKQEIQFSRILYPEDIRLTIQ